MRNMRNQETYEALKQFMQKEKERGHHLYDEKFIFIAYIAGYSPQLTTKSAFNMINKLLDELEPIN